jgi:DNA-binding HxlR family transcriptional regulator
LCDTVAVPASDGRPCSVAAALHVVGEKWSLLVVRELSYGVHRFADIARNTGAPRDVLTSRLRSLEAAGVIRREQYETRPPRHEYRLTPAGEELRPILLALTQWGDRWAAAEPPVRFTHDCGSPLELVHTCAACGERVTGRDVRPEIADPGWTVAGPRPQPA